jgi:hypothetical protein
MGIGVTKGIIHILRMPLDLGVSHSPLLYIRRRYSMSIWSFGYHGPLTSHHYYCLGPSQAWVMVSLGPVVWTWMIAFGDWIPYVDLRVHERHFQDTAPILRSRRAGPSEAKRRDYPFTS